MGGEKDINNSTVPGHTLPRICFHFFSLLPGAHVKFLELFFPSLSFLVVLMTILFTILSTISYTQLFPLPGSAKPQSSLLLLLLFLTQLPPPGPTSWVSSSCPAP